MTTTTETVPTPPPLPAAAAPALRWERRSFHAPWRAKWVPHALMQVIGAPGQPALRHLMCDDATGNWTIEECHRADCVPVADFLRQSGASIWVFVSVVQQSLAALSTLHGAGLGHGNVSPETLLVDRTGNVNLSGTAAGRPIVLDETQPDEETPPAVPAATVADDLRDLGRTFRSVLCGDPEAKVAAIRPDIAPMVAAWIDWLASPPLGRAARSAAEAATVLNDLRTGKASRKPWEDEEELPSRYVLEEASSSSRSKNRGPALFGGSDGGGLTKGHIMAGSALVLLLAGGIAAINYFYKDKKLEAAGSSLHGSGTGSGFRMLPGTGGAPDGMFAFDGIAAGYDPAAATQEQLDKLLSVLPPVKSTLSEWAKKLEERSAQTRTAENPAEPAAPETEWLYAPDIFPIVGKPSTGRLPGDYYLVWRTHQFTFTGEECRSVQRAMLKAAGFSGVQLLSWTVLPNQAAAVVRVPDPVPVTDEVLLRRIALLRGEKTSAGVQSQIDAALKAGNAAAADRVRLQWNASMGSAAGFLSVVRSVPVIPRETLGAVPLWQAKPARLHSLTPDTNQILHAAGVVDTAAVRARLVEVPGNWPLCSLSAAQLKYKPALYGVAVLMQRNPYRTLPPMPREDTLNALSSWQRYLGEFSRTGTPPPPPGAVDPGAPVTSTSPIPEEPALQ